MLKNTFTFVILAVFQLLQAVPTDVTLHGIRADSSINSAVAIQHLVDSLHEAGGGTLNFPPGDYMSSTFALKSNVFLHMEAGATLWASMNEEDYDNEYAIYKKFDSGKMPEESTPVLIYAKDAENIGITGKGSINGRARRVYEPLRQVDGFIARETEIARKAGVEMKMYYKVKPYTCMVFLESCSHITISGVSLVESTDWTLHFKWCDQITVDRIHLTSSLEKGVNADGIDIDGCRNVLISNCIIETGDDAIVLKSTLTGEKYQPCENVAVSNCVLVSTSTALKIGTETFGDFRYITFNNCVIRNTNRGLSIVVRDGATVEHVLFSNITMETDRKHFNWWGNGDPIWLVVKKREADSKIGSIREVSFQHIQARGQGTSKIEGFPGMQCISGIRLDNVHITMEAEDLPDHRATSILEVTNAANIYMDDCSLRWDLTHGSQNSWDVPLVVENINILNISDMVIEPLKGTGMQIRQTNVYKSEIKGLNPIDLYENNEK